MKFPAILLVLIVIATGCVQQEIPVTEVSIPGHNEIYTFSNDLREVLPVAASGQEEIRQQFLGGQMNFVFDGSSAQDNAYFTIVMTNIMAKVPIYLAYEGVVLKFQSYYFMEDVWFDRSGNEIEKPDLSGTTLWLKGPSTGAEGTSVNIINNTIFVQGTSYKNLTLAGDKLTLVVMGIDSLPQP